MKSAEVETDGRASAQCAKDGQSPQQAQVLEAENWDEVQCGGIQHRILADRKTEKPVKSGTPNSLFYFVVSLVKWEMRRPMWLGTCG